MFFRSRQSVAVQLERGGAMRLLSSTLFLLATCLLPLASCNDETPVSGCRLVSEYKGLPVYCCSSCSTPSTQLNVLTVGPTGACNYFCNSCIPSSHTRVQQCPIAADAGYRGEWR